MIGVESLLFTEPRVGVICGVDEAGRGPLFGNVVAAAVILDPKAPIEGLGDSKKLTEKVRERLYDQIYARAISVGVGRASVEEIDQLNILQASMLAMQRAVESDKENEPVEMDVYFIVNDKCTECVGFHDEPQCAAVCPVDCCIPDENFVEKESSLLEKKDSLHIS